MVEARDAERRLTLDGRAEFEQRTLDGGDLVCARPVDRRLRRRRNAPRLRPDLLRREPERPPLFGERVQLVGEFER